MGQDGRLGNTGGARGIDQAGGVIGLERLPAADEQPRSPAAKIVAPSQRLLPTNDPVVQLRRAALDQDGALEQRQVGSHGHDLLEELAIVDYEDL